jgi:hypothetical protein
MASFSPQRRALFPTLREDLMSLYVDIAVNLDAVADGRNGVNPARVYLESVSVDNASWPILSEIDIPRPSKPVAGNTAYDIWSLDITDLLGIPYSIGAKVDGVKLSTIETHVLAHFPPCSTRIRRRWSHVLLVLRLDPYIRMRCPAVLENF